LDDVLKQTIAVIKRSERFSSQSNQKITKKRCSAHSFLAVPSNGLLGAASFLPSTLDVHGRDGTVGQTADDWPLQIKIPGCATARNEAS